MKWRKRNLQKKILLKKFFAKNFFSSLNMYQANLVSNIFPFTAGGEGGFPLWNFFFLSEHVSSQIWCQKFSLYWGGVPVWKFFSSLNMYQAKSGVKNFPFTGGVPLWIFFSSLKMYQAKSGVKNFSLYWVGVGEVSLCENFFSSLNMYQARWRD